MLARVVSSRTIRYRAGASASVTGTARAALTAILSENQYDPPTMARPRNSPSTRPGPLKIAPPISMKKPPSAARRTYVLIVFLLIWHHLPDQPVPPAGS